MDVTLKEAREKAGYSIEDVAETLKIRKQYIIDLEEEVYKNIPGQVYIDGYKKMYCEFLSIQYPECASVNVEQNKSFTPSKKMEKSYAIFFSIFILFIVVSLYSLI